MTIERGQRFCTCGWSVFGTEMERRNAFASHHVSEEHKKRLAKTSSNIDHLVEWDIERRTDES